MLVLVLVLAPTDPLRYPSNTSLHTMVQDCRGCKVVGCYRIVCCALAYAVVVPCDTYGYSLRYEDTLASTEIGVDNTLGTRVVCIKEADRAQPVLVW